jgi:hypothetical protein
MRALLPARSERLADAMRTGVLTVMSLYGAGKMNYLLIQLRDSLAASHAFLDDDEAGRTAAEVAEAAGLLATTDATFAMCPGARKDSEFEDLVNPSCYKEAFDEQFGVSLDHVWVQRQSKGKWSKRMSVVFGASGAKWDGRVENQAKALVAQCVEQAPNTAIKDGCDGVIAGLTRALERKLDARIG